MRGEAVVWKRFGKLYAEAAPGVAMRARARGLRIHAADTVDCRTPAREGDMAEGDGPVEVVREEAEERFAIHTGGEPAFLTYSLTDGSLYLLHTEVPEALEGRGLGSELVRAALEHARAEGMTVVALCPFVGAYLRRHPEYGDLVRSGEPDR